MTDTPPVPPPLPPASSIKSPNLDGYLRNQSHHEGNERICCCDIEVISKNKRITRVKPIAQSGPNCGIAALAMALSLTPSSLTVDDIFAEAKSRGFTNNGEMFSAHNMKTLVDIVAAPWLQTEMFSDGLAINEAYVVDQLYSGDLMLVPYDADKDHTPCCKEGHKAHWALLCGVSTDATGRVSVAARHGKSRHLAIWGLEQLIRSNNNLSQLDPERADDGREYVLPPGGVRAGLASQFILLRRTTPSSSDHVQT